MIPKYRCVGSPQQCIFYLRILPDVEYLFSQLKQFKTLMGRLLLNCLYNCVIVFRTMKPEGYIMTHDNMHGRH